LPIGTLNLNYIFGFKTASFQGESLNLIKYTKAMKVFLNYLSMVGDIYCRNYSCSNGP